MEGKNRSGLGALSDELAGLVEVAGAWVVTVEGRRRLGATGIVWPEGSGTVVTADHVLERDEEIRVVLPDGTGAQASIVGRDPGTDIAVLRLEAGVPAPAPLAALDSLRVGHLVLAVGRPRPGAPQASIGVVSALGGPWQTARGGRVEGYVRSDVTLFPGFSGGPLVDVAGRVVGLNSWYLARGRELAIPAAFVGVVARALLSHGRVRRGYLGITSQAVPLSDAIRAQHGLTQRAGLMVVGVEAESAAARGDLLMGDVVLAIGGQTVEDAGDLRAALSADAVDRPVVVRLLRGGEVKELTVTPTERT